MAQIHSYDNVGMRADQRCDRCGAQAFVEAKFPGHSLLLCAHHGNEHMPKLSEIENVVIFDHRPFLAYEESKPEQIPSK